MSGGFQGHSLGFFLKGAVFEDGAWITSFRPFKVNPAEG